MSDSSIPNNQSTHTDTVKLSQTEERLQARLQEQSEWYRLRKESFLCDCSNCINARDLKGKADLVGKSAGRRQAVVALAKQPDISQHWPTPDIRSLFRFILPSDEAIAISDIYS
jgi:hypothetical protein